MATFKKRVTKTKGTVWDAIVRKAGFPATKRSFSTKGEATAWAVEYEKRLAMKRNGDPLLAGTITLGEALDKFTEDSMIEGKSPTTLDREQRSYKHIKRVLGDNTSLLEITTVRLHDYQRKRKEEGYSASSIRQELCIISKIFTNARKIWRINVENPVDDLSRIPPGPANLRFLTKEEAAIVVTEAQRSRNKKFYPFVLLLMHTGMRSGEAASLNQKDVNLEKRFIKITKTKTDVPRTVPLTKKVVSALSLLKVEKGGYYFLKPIHFESERYMLAPGSIFRDCWDGLRKRINREHPDFPYFRPHDLRHTAASHLLMAGVDIRVVADILGHSTLSMVMRYTHLLDDYRQDVIDKIGELGEEG